MTTPSFVAWCVARGRILFNRGDFWGCHEALELAWRRSPNPDRVMLQALIQAAAAFHKLVVQDNRVGARRLIGRALDRLDPDSYEQFGLAIGPFRTELESWQRRLYPTRATGHEAGAERLAAHDEVADDAHTDARTAPLTEGPLHGLPRLEWTDRASAGRISVDAVRHHEVEVGGRRAVLVELQAGDVVGWGECRSSWGTHGLWDSLVHGVTPALLTEPVAAPSEARLLWGDITETPSAVAGVEAALWDVWARKRGVSLCEAYGHAARPVPLAGRVRPGDGAGFAGAVHRLSSEGYRRIIVPARPNADRRVIPALVAGCSVPIAIDLGGAYRLADYHVLSALDNLHPSCFVQPVPTDDLATAGRLVRYLTTPISMGGWESVEAIESAFELRACDIVHVDAARLGPTGVLCVAEVAAYMTHRIWLTSSAATAVGAYGELALAAHPAFTEPSDLSLGQNEDAQPAVVPSVTGTATPLPDTGLGYVPSRRWLDAVTIRRVEMRA